MNLDYCINSTFFKPETAPEEMKTSSAVIPDYYRCARTGNLMQNPVVNPLDGLSYEKTAIPENELVNFIPNINLKSIIHDFTLRLPQIKENYWCSCTMDFMNDPVLTCDGQTYERKFIENWLINLNKDTSPNTNEILKNKTLIPNKNLQLAITDFIKSQQPDLENNSEPQHNILTNANISHKHTPTKGKKQLSESKTENTQNLSCNMKELNKLAHANNADAQIKLALMYIYCRSQIIDDQKKAAHWLLLAKNAVNTPAGLLAQGLCYDFGYENNQASDATTLSYYEKAASYNYAPAQYILGMYYIDTPSARKEDLNNGIKYLTLAANNDYALAHYALGKLYSNDDRINLPKNQKLAKKHYVMAANQGLNIAINDLGSMFLDDKDYKKAVEYFKLAASENNPQALSNLGTCYFNGLGVTKNEETALKYYKLAASYKNGNALFNLGLYFCCCNDTKSAIQYFEEALKLIDPNTGDKATYLKALTNLAACYCKQGAQDNDYKKMKLGVKCFESAAAQGSSLAYFHLAEIYLAKKDISTAFYCYQMVIKDIQCPTYPKALYRIGQCYSNEGWSSKDLQQAEKYFRLAARYGITSENDDSERSNPCDIQRHC